MENYNQLISEQAKALQKDIDQLITNIKNQEIILEEMKDKKSKAWSILKSIEKKLAK